MRYTFNVGWNLQSKDTISLVLGTEELPRVNGINNVMGVMQGATLLSSKFATSPASIDEPARDIVVEIE